MIYSNVFSLRVLITKILIILFLILAFSLSINKTFAQLPFGGPVVFGSNTICTCPPGGNAVWFWDYKTGSTRPVGLHATPFANYKLQAATSGRENAFLTPGIQGLGAYTPGASSCLFNTGVSGCIPVPLEGALVPTGVEPGTGSSGAAIPGITSLPDFLSLASIAEGIHDDAKNGGGGGCFSGGGRFNCLGDDDFNKELTNPIMCETTSVGTECDDRGPLGVGCRSDKAIVEVGEEITWHVDVVGGRNVNRSSQYHVFWESDHSDLDIKRRRGEALAEYDDSGVKTVHALVIPRDDLENRNAVSCSVEVVEKDSDEMVVGCTTSSSVVSNIEVVDNEFKRVTWIAEARGGEGPYTYSWSGVSESDIPNQSLIVNYKNRLVGIRTGVVTATSADGQTAQATCSIEVVGR